MADRVSASIIIGGNLSADLLAAFVRVIQNEGLSTEWDGEPFDPSELSQDEPLRLMAHEVAWGRFEKLEAFCRQNALPFARWCAACPGQWRAQRVVFYGSGEAVSYRVDDAGNVVVNREAVNRLGILEAVIAYFDAADFPIPPLVVIADAKETGNG